MKHPSFAGVIVVGIALVILTACASAAPNSAPAAIEAYFKALVAKNSTAAINASCANWEDDAKQEADAFAAVAPSLSGLSCSVTGTDPDGTLVTCEGVINVTYNNEAQVISLADNGPYLAVEENGEWRMCGYR
jgi:hypothetical protein